MARWRHAIIKIISNAMRTAIAECDTVISAENNSNDSKQ
jgi:hypothetical protein